MLTHGLDSKHKAKAHKMLSDSGYSVSKAKGGAIAKEKAIVKKAIKQHEAHEHKGQPKTKLKLKSGGVADHEKSNHRADKPSRLAKGGKAHTKINIMVAPGKGGDNAPAAPMNLPGGNITPPQMPPRPPVSPGIAAPMMRQGMMPQAVKTGGKINGRYDAGAGSGEGRLEKEKNYKKSVKK